MLQYSINTWGWLTGGGVVGLGFMGFLLLLHGEWGRGEEQTSHTPFLKLHKSLKRT